MLADESFRQRTYAYSVCSGVRGCQPDGGLPDAAGRGHCDSSGVPLVPITAASVSNSAAKPAAVTTLLSNATVTIVPLADDTLIASTHTNGLEETGLLRAPASAPMSTVSAYQTGPVSQTHIERPRE